MQRLGMECLAHSEINKDADRTYNLFFNDENNLGDLTKIDFEKIPQADILLAGFPCQTFSILGKRKGFDDERGQIIYHLSKILRARKIPYFILENVKGLASHGSGETLASIVALLSDSGYKVFHEVLNSADFGVPQDRERIYFVGIRNDLLKKDFSFPKPRGAQVPFSSIVGVFENSNVQDINHPTFKKYLNNKYNKGRVDINEILKDDYTVVDTRQSDLRTYKNKCATLRLGRQGILYVRQGKLYKLSGQEALLLQGFTKEYARKSFAIPQSLLLRQAGNAMTVNVINAIGKSLLDCIEKS